MRSIRLADANACVGHKRYRGTIEKCLVQEFGYTQECKCGGCGYGARLLCPSVSAASGPGPRGPSEIALFPLGIHPLAIACFSGSAFTPRATLPIGLY